MFNRARDYFSSRPQAAAQPLYRSNSSAGLPVSTAGSAFGSVSSVSLSPASAALTANTGMPLYPPPNGSQPPTPSYFPAYNATQLQAPYGTPPPYGDPRNSMHPSPRTRKLSGSGRPPVLTAHNPNTPLYGRDPQRAYATGSQGSFQSFASSMKQEPIPTPSTRMSMAKKMGRRKRALSDAAPPAPHFYTEPAYRAQQFYPMGPTSPMPNTAYAAVPTPGSRAMPLSTPRYETAPGRPGRTPSQSSLQMAVYHHEQNTPAYVPRETFTPEMAPREPPRVLRRRRTVSSTQTHPPQIPIPGHVANMEPASYGSHGSYMMQAHSQGPKKQPQLPTIKFKRKGIPQGGVTLSEAITGVRMSRKDRYPVRMMHADPDMNVLIKITWPNCRSLTYAIAVNARDGRVDLTTLTRRIARACHHFLDARQVMLPRERMRIHRIEEFSSGHWQVVWSGGQ